MNSADTIAFAALMLFLIVVVGVVADIYKRRLDFKEKSLELLSRESADQAAHYAAQAQRLEQRVRVLERIATDRAGAEAADLADQIEDLRSAAVG